MPNVTGPSDPNVVSLINKLRKTSSENNTELWKTIAEKLGKSRRKNIAVNLSKINRFTKKNDVVVVPGSVLSAGYLDHKVKIAALRFSERAKQKINEFKGESLTIAELLEEKPDESTVKIII